MGQSSNTYHRPTWTFVALEILLSSLQALTSLLLNISLLSELPILLELPILVMSASGRSTAKMGDTHAKGDHVNTRSRGSVTTKDNPENESLANLIRSIMDEKLDPIKNSISSLSDSINDSLESAKAASTMATEAKTIATQSHDIANEAKSIAADAQVSASGASAAAVEAKSIASKQVAELKTQFGALQE